MIWVGRDVGDVVYHQRPQPSVPYVMIGCAHGRVIILARGDGRSYIHGGGTDDDDDDDDRDLGVNYL